jgi:hypothetical protein
MFRISENEEDFLDEATINIKNYSATSAIFEFFIKTDLIEET